MKVAILSYPMLFQEIGGLYIQILETISALNALGVDARLVNPNKDMLVEYDVIHIFSAINGNHRIVEYAKAIGKPVVTSPLIQGHWDNSLGIKARLLEAIVGRITSWNVKTEYRQIESCLANSDKLIALGGLEKKSIEDGFKIPGDKINIIPNGIPSRFFNATSTLFADKTGINNGFILCVASIDSHKNQSTLVESSKHLGLPIVLIGPYLPANKPYLDKLLVQSHVHYLGALKYDDPILASAYAAASVFCIPSMSEVMPLCVLEALASGTPVVMTKYHGMDIGNMREVVHEIDPCSIQETKTAIENWLETPPSSGSCKRAVKDLTWKKVACAIRNIYEEFRAP